MALCIGRGDPFATFPGAQGYSFKMPPVYASFDTAILDWDPTGAGTGYTLSPIGGGLGAPVFDGTVLSFRGSHLGGDVLNSPGTGMASFQSAFTIAGVMRLAPAPGSSDQLICGNLAEDSIGHVADWEFYINSNGTLKVEITIDDVFQVVSQALPATNTFYFAVTVDPTYGVLFRFNGTNLSQQPWPSTTGGLLATDGNCAYVGGYNTSSSVANAPGYYDLREIAFIPYRASTRQLVGLEKRWREQYHLPTNSNPARLQIEIGGTFSTGLEGGPYPSSPVLLRNLGDVAMTWGSIPADSWATLVPSNGVLAAASDLMVQVTYHGDATNFISGGSYTSSLTITNQTSTAGTKTLNIFLAPQ